VDSACVLKNCGRQKSGTFSGRLKLQDRKMQNWKMTDKFEGVENAGLEIDGQKLQGVENN